MSFVNYHVFPTNLEPSPRMTMSLTTAINEENIKIEPRMYALGVFRR